MIDPEVSVKNYARIGWLKVVEYSEPLLNAAKVMVENKIRHVPIVSNKKLIGMLSVKDVIDKLNALNMPDLLKSEVGKLGSGKVIASKPDEPLWLALKVMKEADVGALPIVNEEGEVIGIFTERDVVTQIAPEIEWDKSVKEVGLENPKTVELGTPILDVISLMNEMKIRHVPVVDSSGAVKGMVTALDVIGYALENDRYKKGIRIFEDAVDTIMKQPVFVREDATLNEALNVLANSNYDYVLIVGEDLKLKEILTDRDVLRITADLMEKLHG
ncbi:CBS domain-containing protein [Ignicoccus islandicus]|uniref:CBS domain-containing protein n=1 Tax=Ignicoccus islandicus TaxID=54259 RepID=UPI0009467913|nr:CBS domain-containing protein [Ignicoccus islandicus]